MKHYERVVESLRFVVRESFTLSGRGTVALGYIESGTVVVGDDLVLMHEDDHRTGIRWASSLYYLTRRCCRRHVGSNAEGRTSPSDLCGISTRKSRQPEASQIRQSSAVRIAPLVVTMAPVVRVELARVEALELLGMTLAHLNDAEGRGEMSPRVPLLMAIRDKLALALREEP